MPGRDLLQDLNPEQQRFVMSNARTILALAGPGSGKTRCLTYRAARLIQDGILPSQIMLTTFTNRAAHEIKERITKLIPTSLTGIWAGTFHSLGARFLRSHAERVGLRPNFTIVDGIDAQELIKMAADEASFLVTAPPETRRFFNKARLNTIVSLVRNTNQLPGDVLSHLYPEYAEYSEDFDLLLERYQQLKRERNVCDFDDLLVYWVDILESHNDVLSDLQNQLHHVLVDEYQDTNAIQDRIIQLLGRASHVAVVGDADQSIYKFRGADIENILRFQSVYRDVEVIRLETNYRSNPQIVALANNSISNNRKRLDKTLRTPNIAGRMPLWYEHENPKTEADWLVTSIQEFLRKGIPPHEIAVLYRSSFMASLLEFAVMEAKLSYQMYGGLPLLERAHIKDVLSWIRLFVNPKDELAWKRALMLLPGIGHATADQIWDLVKDDPDPVLSILSDMIKPPARVRGWGAVKQVLSDLMSCGRRPGRMLRATLTDDYVTLLNSLYDDADERVEDIERLANYADDFGDVLEFVEHVSLDEQLTLKKNRDGVILSTIHSAKGKEFEVVYIIGCNEYYMPSAKAIEADDIEEERRLFYVAVTRAKSELFFSSCRTATNRGHFFTLKPSRFLQELDRKLYHYIPLR